MKLLVLVALFLTLYAQDFGCLSFYDTYLYFTNRTDGNVTLECYGAERRGYVGLSFQEDKNIEKSAKFMIVAQVGGKIWSTNAHHGNYSSSPPLDANFDEAVGLKIDNLFRFSVTLPYASIAKTRYIGIARGYGSLGSRHEEYDFRLSTVVYPNVSLQQAWCDPVFLKHTGRILSDYVWLFFPTTFFYFGVFFAVIYFRNEQPLKSRGLGPMLAPLGLYGNLLFGFIAEQYFTYEEQYQNACFLVAFGEYLCTLSSCVIPCVLMFRYISLINLNFHKEKLMKSTKNSETIEKAPWRVRVLNHFTNPILLILAVVVVCSIYVLVGIAAFSIFGWQCGTFASTFMRYVTIVIIVIICASTALFQLYDIINNRKMIFGCQWRKYFIDTDHFYYRLEILPAPLVVVAAALWILAPVPTTFHIIFCEMIYVVALWICCVFSLLTTMILYYRDKCHPVKQEEVKGSVDAILSDPNLSELLVEYCKHEFSLENIYFKQAIFDYKKTQSVQERERMVKNIDGKFLMSSSPFQVNLPSNVLETIKMQQEKLFFPSDLFSECDLEVSRNLQDTIHRFRFSAAYSAHQSKLKSLGVEQTQ